MRLTELPPLGRLPRPRKGPPPAAAGLAEIADFGPNPGTLRMFVHIPPRLPKSAALVVILHGCGQTAAGYAQGTGWTDAADRMGFALLAPEQSSANNIGGCFNWFQPGDTVRDGGEVASIRQMIARLVEDHGLDPARVYVTGLSAGGAMTAALLSAYPEIFAGGAVIAGLPYGAATNVPEALNAMRHAPEHSNAEWAARVRSASSWKGPWPKLSIWHGDADATVDVRNADALAGQWTALHKLSSHAPEIEDGAGYTRRSWYNAAGETVVESWRLAGLAHGAPVHAGHGKDACGQPGPYFIETGLSSTLKIAAFWGLARAVPVPHKVTPHLVVKNPPPPHAASRPKPATPVPLASMLKPGRKLAGVHGIITKALKAAGLIKKS